MHVLLICVYQECVMIIHGDVDKLSRPLMPHTNRSGYSNDCYVRLFLNSFR